MNSYVFSSDIEPEDVSPIEPSAWATIEKWIVSLSLFAFLLVGIAKFDSLRSFYIELGASQIAIVLIPAFLAIDRVGRYIVAYRRYGYVPGEYKVARGRAKGTMLTRNEAQNLRREWERNRADMVQDSLNSSLRDLQKFTEHTVEVEKIDDSFVVTLTEDSSRDNG